MEKNGSGAIVFGRKAAKQGEKGAAGKRRFSESALFTLGLVFVIVYFAGLLWSSGSKDNTAETGAVAVFADKSEAPKEDGIWDRLDRCFEYVFGKGDGAEK